MFAEKIFPWVTSEDVALSNQKFEAAGKSYLLDKYLDTSAYCTAALRLNPSNVKNIKLLMGLAIFDMLKEFHYEGDINIEGSPFDTDPHKIY